MAGYFITTNEHKFNKLKQKISKDFPKFKSKENIGDKKWNILYFQKINIDSDNIFSEGDDFIIGTGTYIYKGEIGFLALQSIFADFKENPLIVKEVLGHFNFVIYYKGKLKIVTDKSGYYFAYSSTENKENLYSTSLTTMASYLDTPKYATQELLEFVNVAASFGGKTIFENINHLEPGKIIDIDTGNKTSFYDMAVAKTSFNSFIKKIERYFANFSDLKVRIGADLSGGFDTRTIAAALLNSKTSFEFLTNDRPEHVSKDKETAKKIAKKFETPIHTIPIEENYKQQQLSNIEIIKSLEATRGIDISKRVYNEIQNKSKNHELIIGGWGAEMLRNQHGRFNNIKDLVRGFGYLRIDLEKEEKEKYIQNLEKKLASLYQIENTSKSKISELAFYMEKGKYWAGSVLSARNKYAFWIFPFFDPELSLPLLSLGGKGNNLQNRVINELYDEFKVVPYGNIDTESVFKSTLKKYIKKVISYRGKKRKATYDYPQDTDFKNFSVLEDIIKLNQDFLVSKGASRSVSKYETLGELLEYLDKRKEN
jgi:hypothetical protein